MTVADVAAELLIVPANEASWEDIDAVFGERGEAHVCQCQRYKLSPGEAFKKVPVEERAHRLRTQTECDHPKSKTTSGLVAYLAGEPVGWCAVEPRTAYFGLMRNFKVHWDGRNEDKGDDTVWSVTCFVVRAGYRRRGVSRALARAAVDFARERGARAIEAYPMLVDPGHDVQWGELHVGKRSIFDAAGYSEVSHPSKRRVVMRIDFERSSRKRASVTSSQEREHARREELRGVGVVAREARVGEVVLVTRVHEQLRVRGRLNERPRGVDVALACEVRICVHPVYLRRNASRPRPELLDGYEGVEEQPAACARARLRELLRRQHAERETAVDEIVRQSIGLAHAAVEDLHEPDFVHVRETLLDACERLALEEIRRVHRVTRPSQLVRERMEARRLALSMVEEQYVGHFSVSFAV